MNKKNSTTFTEQQVDELLEQVRKDCIENSSCKSKIIPLLFGVGIVLCLVFSVLSFLKEEPNKDRQLYIFNGEPTVVDAYGNRISSVQAGGALFSKWNFEKTEGNCFSLYSGTFVSNDGFASYTLPIKAGTLEQGIYKDLILGVQVPEFLPAGNYTIKVIFREECTGYKPDVYRAPDLNVTITK